MDNKMIKRLVSLAVALEMLVSPVVMARAEASALMLAQSAEEVPASVEGERSEQPQDMAGETPALSEDQTSAAGSAVSDDVSAPAESAPDGTGTGLPSGNIGLPSDDGEEPDSSQLLALPVSDFVADMSFGIPLDTTDSYPTRYGGYFKWEGGTGSTWGYRAHGLGKMKYFVAKSGKFYTLLPKTGRLPDLKLEGFYVQGEPPENWLDGNSANVAAVKSWVYDESWTNAIRLTETEEKVSFTDEDDEVDRRDYETRAYLTEAELQTAVDRGVVRLDPTWGIGYVPIVARWVASDKDQITSLSATARDAEGVDVPLSELYTENPTGKESPATLTLSDINADTFAAGSVHEFWLRVPEDQQSLTLKFETYEPYYDYNVNGKGSAPVSARVTFNGEDVEKDGQALEIARGWTWNEDGSPADAFIPAPKQLPGGYFSPQNYIQNHIIAARSRWTLADIPLTKVDQAVDMNDPYTNITITVVAPDGVGTSRYTIHVERLMTPTYALGLGNTPPAMIEKDARGNWGGSASIRANKDKAKADFAQYYRLGRTMGIVAPGDYTYYKGQFDPAAWSDFTWEGQKNCNVDPNNPDAGYYNIDLDETAVVAYQDSAFVDPGVSFVGSNGRRVEFGDKAPDVRYKDCVTRTIQLRTADKLTADLYGADSGTECWYTTDASGKAELSNTQASQALRNADGSDGVDLRGLNVLPGVYTITYTFQDPLTKESLEAKRPLVVLPIPGDVDMDGAVTMADALTLAVYQQAWEHSADSDVQLLRYRVLKTASGMNDVTVDAEYIYNGFQPVLANLGQSNYFYPPLPTPADASSTYQRKTWDEVTMNGSARLELRYLGVEQGILQGEELHTVPATDGKVDVTDGKLGPWQADDTASVTLREADSSGAFQYNGTHQNDVFWVGIYLTPGELKGSTVEDLTLSLTYDSGHVRPAVVYQYGQFPGDENQQQRWMSSIFYYNFGDGSKDGDVGQTLFSGYRAGTDYTYRGGTSWGRTYATHYSKVIGELEAAQGGNSSSLREMVISIQGGAANGNRVALPTDGQEVCVLVVPFQLIKHPSGSLLQEGADGKEARLVELGAGMRDFNLVTRAASGSRQGLSAGAMFAQLFSALDESQTRAIGAGDTTYAFSAQESIYGGATRNLREVVSYKDDGDAIPGMIPIGENKSVAKALTAKYAEFFEAKVEDGVLTGTLPRGLGYYHEAAQGVIRGNPVEVGEDSFDFTITYAGHEFYYTLSVEKQTIHFRPLACGSYYGQSEYRGEHDPGFRFTYDVKDIKERDLPEGVTLTGAGTELESILRGDDDTYYVAPTFTAKLSRDSTAGRVTEKSNAGRSYPIVLDDGTALDDKYELVLDQSNLGNQILQIFPRPVWVDFITADAAATGKQIYSDGDRLDQAIILTETDPDPAKKLIHLALREGSVLNGMYGGRPLSGPARVEGDLLTLAFSGEFQREALDIQHFPDNKDTFYMTEEKVERAIAKVSFSEQNRIYFNTNNPNYVLQPVSGNGVLTPDSNDIRGTVIRRKISELEFAEYPVALRKGESVAYGGAIVLQDLRIRISRDGQEVETDFSYDYNSSLSQAMNIHYNWVTKEEMEAGKLSPNTLVGTGWDPTKPKEEQDACPYSDTNTSLSVALDGYYLCAVAQQYESGDPAAQGEGGYVKCYSAEPLHVTPAEVTLTLTNLNRFYGEEGATPRYTYAVNELSSIDLTKLRQHYGRAPTGDPSELEWLLDDNYIQPDIQYMKVAELPKSDKDPNIVTVDTEVTGTTYYLVMSGAGTRLPGDKPGEYKQGNYTFRYARVDGDRRASTEYGTAYLNVMCRPIVVEDILSMKTGDKENFAIIYADSKVLKLTQQVDGEKRTKFEAYGTLSDGALGKVTFTAPKEYDEATQTLTYYNAGNSEVYRQKGMSYSGDPVLENDLAELGVSYNVQFLPDAEHYSWGTMSQNFYSVDDLNATGGQGQRPVELRDLTLIGNKAKNYMLVYNESFHAVQQAPANATHTIAPRPTTSASTDQEPKEAFLEYGTGLVILRPIKSMDIASVGCMSYNYGELFAPENAGVTGKQMVLSVQYDTQYDNNPAQHAGDISHNISSESLAYTYEASTSTFENRGFTIHYIDAPDPASVTTAQKEAIALAADPADRQILMGGERLYPALHDGKRLFVSGKRGENDPLVCSSVTATQLKVAPGALTLTARDVHRYYGEANASGYVIQQIYDPQDNVRPMTYTFLASQLASWDREMLGTLLGKTVAATDILTQEQLETALANAAASGDAAQRAWGADFGYAQPSITTEATRESPINTKEGKWGEYEIRNTAKPFANYQVTGVGAKLYVYPRPIRITGIASSKSDPLYTVYNRTDGRLFNTSLDQKRVSVERSNIAISTDGWPQTLANSTASAFLKLSGNALVGGDELVYKTQVQYLESTVLPEGVTDAYMEVVATISDFGSSPGEAQRNYVLAAAFEDPKAMGAVKLRTIGYILIEELPKQSYTYGETLDLSGLKVRVVYMALGDESQIAEQVDVRYLDPNQFQGYGLYVNYWDTLYDTVPADLKSVPTAYRKAATGDHLTIAPTHDTQQYLGNDMTRPLQRPFAANGVGLIVSAYQEGLNQSAAKPKILAARNEDIPGTGMKSYELTDTNTSAFKFSVKPLQLNYTLSATDKTYDGDVRTAGTLRLTNVFDRANVQVNTTVSGNVQIHNYDTVTDVLYVPVGAAYESVEKPDRYTSYTSASGYQVTGGAIAFTTGRYTPRAAGLLDKNDTVAWAGGYQWGAGLLEFTFPNANVHYVDDSFAAGLPGVGTAELAEYWRASQDFNTADGRWDTFPDISQMPVEVNNMSFRGPDAANYTWGRSTEAQKYETNVTLDSDPAQLGTGQASLPYATVRKANRQSIQELLEGRSLVLPMLCVDVHTNVIRMFYGEDLEKIRDLTGTAEGNGNVLNDTGAEDFRDELHFEYALAYQDAEGLLRQWAGRDGDGVYQDTMFFGGEVFLPQIDPGYVPDVDSMDKADTADEDTVYKGQRYRWADEDTGVSDRGYREDRGFYMDLTAYPGYATYGEAIRDAYWTYDLYNTDRTALPRDTVFYPLVRLAETHNYNPSGDLTGDADGDGRPDISDQALYSARMAVNAYLRGGAAEQAETLKADALSASQSALDAGERMAQGARKQAADKMAADAAISEDAFPETVPPQPDPIPAVKSYLQRLDLISAQWERGMGSADQEYLVQTVEDIHFTDTLFYPTQQLMDAVVYNNPTRYYAYAWDRDLSAQLRFGDEEVPVDLARRTTVTVRERQPDGEILEFDWTYDPEASGHTAKVYVSTSRAGGQVRSIKIVPSILFVRMGDKPIQLGVSTDPKMPTNRYYIWTSSDPSVATVSATGLLTIRGVGMAVITVTTTNRKSDSIAVVVSPPTPTSPTDPTGPSSKPLFNFYYTGSWAELDAGYAFRPKETVTRGEAVELLALFLDPELSWDDQRELAYVDVTGKERYYTALARLTHVNVVTGVPGSAFAGERLATRAEFVTMLARMLRLNVPDTVGMAHAFADSGEDATWAYAYIDAAAKAGVVQGTGGGSFAPGRPITREETAAILARLLVDQLDRARGDLNIPSDMTPENWSYPAVLRAVNSVVAPGY